MNTIKFNAVLRVKKTNKLWNFHVHEIWLLHETRLDSRLSEFSPAHARAIYSAEGFYRLKYMQLCHEHEKEANSFLRSSMGSIKFVAHVLINLLLEKECSLLHLSAAYLSKPISLISSSSSGSSIEYEMIWRRAKKIELHHNLWIHFCIIEFPCYSLMHVYDGVEHEKNVLLRKQRRKRDLCLTTFY